MIQCCAFLKAWGYRGDYCNIGLHRVIVEAVLKFEVIAFKRSRGTFNSFFSFFPSHAMSFFYLCTVGVARQLRRTSTWSHWTRKSTSRSWRRTTTALEKAWGLCWRGRFLSSINPSSGLGWRTGKQTRQYCLHKRHWSEKKNKQTHINDLFITLYDCWNQREVRTNGIEQRSIHTVRVTSANIDSWTRGTVHRSSVEPMPRPICINASLKAEPGASCSTAEGWARCFSPL